MLPFNQRITAALLLPLYTITIFFPLPLLASTETRGEGKAALFQDAEPHPAAVITPTQVSRNPGLKNLSSPVLEARFSTSPQKEEFERSSAFPVALKAEGGKWFKSNEADDLARALKRYEAEGAHLQVRSLRPLQRFLAKYPESPLAASLLTQQGDVFERNGHFTRALDAYRQAWEKACVDYVNNGQIADQALGRYLHLLLHLGQIETAKAVVAKAETLSLGGDGQAALTKAREMLYKFQLQAEESIQCGINAINAACREQPGATSIFGDVHDEAERAKFLAEGMSLLSVVEHANETGKRFVAAKANSSSAVVPVPAIMHWKFGHYSALTEYKDGKYRLVDWELGFDNWVTPEVLAEEGSGYFVLPGEGLPRGFRAVDDQEAAKLFGRHCTHNRDDEGPMPTVPQSGKPGEPGVPAADKNDDDCGMVNYAFRLIDAGLILNDIPLKHSPPLGAPIIFALSYNQRHTNLTTASNLPNLGSRWLFDWLTYIDLTGSGSPFSSVRVRYGDGTYVSFSYNTTFGRYTNAYGLSETVRFVSSKEMHIEFGDGTRRVYAQPNALTPTRLFLTRIIDPRGNVISLDYDANLRLVQIRDALDQPTTLSYAPHAGDPVATDIFKIRSVTDPFGRSCKFHYNGNGELIKIVDTLGLASEMRYAAGAFVDQLTTPYGVTTFRTGGSSGYTANFIEATDPEGDTERVEARDGAPVADSAPVAPASSITVGGVQVPFLVYNSNLYWRNTFHWDKRQHTLYPGDYNKATIYHFAAINGKTTGILESTKLPGEERVWYNYPGQTGATQPGTLNRPSKIARVIEMPDGTTATQLFQNEYNSLGNPTRTIDPAGRQTDYVYAANGLDVIEIRQKALTGHEVLAKVGYLGRLPVSMTDASGRTSSFSYNSRGQVKTQTNALGEVVRFYYDPAGAPNQTDPNRHGYLVAIDGPLPGNQDLATFTYDGFGRVRTSRGPDAYTLTRDYDVFDRLTKLTYPDGTFEQFNYRFLDMQWAKDRRGLWTQHAYNPLRQLVATRDPAGRIIQYQWCKCGDLRELIDAEGRSTRWVRDSQNRIIEKIYSDGSKDLLAYEPLSGRLTTKTDADGRRTQWRYAIDDTVRQVSYTTLSPNPAIPAAAGVEFQYDPYYPRLKSSTDGLGTTTYVYHPIPSLNPGPGAGRLSEVDGPWGNDTLEYAYDAIGRLASRSVNGMENRMSWIYDPAGRVTSHSNPLGNYSFTYAPNSRRLQTMSAPNGLVTTLDYHPLAGDFRLKTLTHTRGTAAISAFDYTYDPAGMIKQMTTRHDNTPALRSDFAYDRADQLTAATTERPTGAASQHRYRYDRAGNRLGEQADNRVTTATINALNQITALSAGGAVRFEGTLDEPAAVTVAGVSATVDGSNRFQADVNLVPGTQRVTVAATDAAGNTATKNYTFDVEAGANRTLAYDLAGNLLNDGAGRTLTWDAAGRLVKVQHSGGTTEWVYNGAGRRVLEKRDGVEVRRWVWGEGPQPLEERNPANTVVKRFYAGLGEQWGTSKYYYTTDHLGSVRELTDSTGAIRARYSYTAYGERTQVSGDLDATFGYTGYLHHAASGLNLALYRAYDPQLGRWLSRDPIAERGGVNLYAYVGNNPVIYVDPYGLIRWGNLGTGVSQVATGGLKIAGAAALTAGAAPTGGWSLVGAAYLAIESAGNITIGLANIAISLSDDPDDDCLAKQLQGLPTSIPTAIARGVGGEMVQAGVDVAETIATGAVNLASNPTQKLDAVKDGVELVVKLNSAAEAAPGPYDHE